MEQRENVRVPVLEADVKDREDRIEAQGGRRALDFLAVDHFFVLQTPYAGPSDSVIENEEQNRKEREKEWERTEISKACHTRRIRSLPLQRIRRTGARRCELPPVHV